MRVLASIRSMYEHHKGDVLALLVLASWPLIYFWPAAVRMAVFSYGDILLFFYPTHLDYAVALGQGRLPLWEPNLLAGFPLFAEGQIGALYPIHPLIYGFLPIDLATNYDILFHLAWVGIGTYLFARAIRLMPPSALLSAFSFLMGGFFLVRLQHMSVLATAAWLPWLLWGWEKFEQEQELGRSLRWFVLLALMAGVQLLGGHPQFAFSSGLLLSLYALVRWKRDDLLTPALTGQVSAFKQARHFLSDYIAPRRLIPAVIILGTGVALAAMQLIPTFELASYTNRAGGLDARFFNAFSLRLPHYLMLFNPFVLGNPWPMVSVEVVGYVGLMTIALAISAFFLRRDRRVVFFAIIALVALFLGLGDINIFYRALRHLPLFNYFRVPSRFLMWFTFAAAILGGIAFNELLQRAKRTERVTWGQKWLMLVVALVVACVVGLVPWVPLNAWLSAWVWLPILFGCFSVWIILGARKGLFSQVTLATLTLGILIIDLASFGAVYSKTYNAMSSVADFYATPDVLAQLKGLSPQEGRAYTSTWIMPWQSGMRASLYPNVALTYGVPNAIGYTPLLPQRTSVYLEEMSPAMFNLMNIRYYVLPQLLPINAGTEGLDTWNRYNLNPVGHDIVIPPTAAKSLKITSSVSQSGDWEPGKVVAEVYLQTEDGKTLNLPLRAGIETGEWAYERSDVIETIKYPMPVVSTSYPALSAFPTRAHTGHTFLAELPLSDDEQVQVITGLFVYPKVTNGLFNVERVYLTSPEGEDISVAHLVGKDDQMLVYRTNEVAVFENPDALPRAFLVHDAKIADDSKTENEMFRTDFKPLETIFIADGEAIESGGKQNANEQVRILEYKNERVVLSVRAESDGYLLLTDSWFPGWTAQLDGKEVPIRRGDLIFRAIRVGAGDHRIEMEYHPTSLYVGMGVSLGALALLGLLVLGSRRLKGPVI